MTAGGKEGRTIYDNLRKAIVFILPTNGAEALVVLAAIVLGFVYAPFRHDWFGRLHRRRGKQARQISQTVPSQPRAVQCARP